jgi:hypothetical protein
MDVFTPHKRSDIMRAAEAVVTFLHNLRNIPSA